MVGAVRAIHVDRPAVGAAAVTRRTIGTERKIADQRDSFEHHRRIDAFDATAVAEPTVTGIAALRRIETHIRIA